MVNPYIEEFNFIGFSKDPLSFQDVIDLKVLLNTGLYIKDLPYGNIEDSSLLNYQLAIYFSTSTTLNIRPFGNILFQLKTNMPSICIYEGKPFFDFSSEFVNSRLENALCNSFCSHGCQGWEDLENYFDFYISSTCQKYSKDIHRYKDSHGQVKYIQLDYHSILEKFKEDILKKIATITQSDNYFNFTQFPSSIVFDYKKIKQIKMSQFFEHNLKNKSYNDMVHKI